MKEQKTNDEGSVLMNAPEHETMEIRRTILGRLQLMSYYISNIH